jgi:hypothetical protein
VDWFLHNFEELKVMKHLMFPKTKQMKRANKVSIIYVEMLQLMNFSKQLKKLKQMKSTLLSIAFFLMIINLAEGQSKSSFPQEITNAVQQGDAGELAGFFNNKIELILPAKSGVFSKEQAQFMMKEFFDNNPSTSFQIIHQGMRDNSSFAIGRYSCAKGPYRLQFLTKNIDNQTLIIQIRIDRQDD